MHLLHSRYASNFGHQLCPENPTSRSTLAPVSWLHQLPPNWDKRPGITRCCALACNGSSNLRQGEKLWKKCRLKRQLRRPPHSAASAPRRANSPTLCATCGSPATVQRPWWHKTAVARWLRFTIFESISMFVDLNHKRCTVFSEKIPSFLPSKRFHRVETTMSPHTIAAASAASASASSCKGII